MRRIDDGAARASARRALDGLRGLLGFDSALLVRLGEQERRHEVIRLGYRPRSAAALTHRFGEVFSTGFTRRFSTSDGLPLSISDGPLGVRSAFTASEVFREHLSPEGYRDGMSIELSDAGKPIGLAHFSSRGPDRFTYGVRRQGAAVAGLLAVVVGSVPVSAPDGAGAWQIGPGHGGDATHPLAGDERFARHLDLVMALEIERVDHLWLGAGGRWRITMQREATQRWSVEVAPEGPEAHHGMSDQEIRVLSALCTGASDAEIAAGLHLSVRTVHSHVAAVRRRIGAANRVAAAVQATAAGLYEPDPRRCRIDRIIGPYGWG